ncbi:MAG: FAD-dependent oxidoreductase [Actinomycetota bacterium]|nr:FAD-dependent oxidoreductase [Actinomycetota bacterium]
MGKLHQQNESIWISTTNSSATFPPLTGDADFDVVVAGGGITGLTAALLLKQRGRKVALIESDRIASGVTGYTTAKVTSLHSLTYTQLTKDFGHDNALVYAQANQAAIQKIADLIEEFDIDCDHSPQPAFTYTESQDLVSDIQKEVEATLALGLPAALVEEIDLPYAVKAAIRFDDQALFHPRKYCIALATAIDGDGSAVFETTKFLDVDKGDRLIVETDKGSINADHLIIATHIPTVDKGLYFGRTIPERSYALAVRIPGKAPHGMYISIDTPSRSVRPHPALGDDLVIIGGENHRVGEEPDTEKRYQTLEAWARSRFDVSKIENRWSAQDYMPADGVPFIGANGPNEDRIFVATGFNKWGMTNGTAAAMILADRITGVENPWAKFFDSTRLDVLKSAKEVIKQSAASVDHLLGDRLRTISVPAAQTLRNGEGGLVELDGEKVAAYRDESGALKAVSPACTHMGCLVSFNGAEKTWDCPCHGSRFDLEGKVIQGPAVKDLEPRSE